MTVRRLTLRVAITVAAGAIAALGGATAAHADDPLAAPATTTENSSSSLIAAFEGHMGPYPNLADCDYDRAAFQQIGYWVSGCYTWHGADGWYFYFRSEPPI